MKIPFFKKQIALILFSLLGCCTQLLVPSTLTDNDALSFFVYVRDEKFEELTDWIKGHPLSLTTSFKHPVTKNTTLTLLHLVSAIENDTVAQMLVKTILKAKPSPSLEVEDSFGETPFTLAYRNNNRRTAHYLLKYGAKANHLNKKNSSILQIAVDFNDKYVIQKFLKIEPSRAEEIYLTEQKYNELVLLLEAYQSKETTKNILCNVFLKLFYGNSAAESLNQINDFCSPTTGQTLLHEVIKHHAPELISVLLNKGANPFRVNRDGKNALELAIEEHVFSGFRLFIEKNKPKILTDIIDQEGNTILHLMAKKTTSKGEALVDFVMTRKALYLKNKSGETPLAIAAKSGNLFMIIKLIKAGSILYKDTSTWRDDLHAIVKQNGDKLRDEDAIFENFDKPYKSCIDFAFLNKKLKEEKIVINATIEKGTPLFSLNNLKLIIKKDGTVLNARTPYNPTFHFDPQCPSNCPLGSMLHEACYRGWLNVVKLIIENGGDPSSTDSWNNTPLHIAVQEGHTDIINYLLSKKVPLTYNKDNQTPLHIACRQNNKVVVELLVNKTDSNSLKTLINQEENPTYPSPFAIACQEGNLALVNFFIEHSAYLNGVTGTKKRAFLSVKTNAKKSAPIYHDIVKGPLPPLFHALEKGHLHIIKRLIEQGATPNMPDLFGITLQTYLCLGKVYQSSESKETTPNNLVQYLYQKGFFTNTRYTPSTCISKPLSQAVKACAGKTNQQLAQAGGNKYIQKLFNLQLKQKKASTTPTSNGLNG